MQRDRGGLIHSSTYDSTRDTASFTFDLRSCNSLQLHAARRSRAARGPRALSPPPSLLSRLYETARRPQLGRQLGSPYPESLGATQPVGPRTGIRVHHTPHRTTTGVRSSAQVTAESAKSTATYDESPPLALSQHVCGHGWQKAASCAPRCVPPLCLLLPRRAAAWLQRMVSEWPRLRPRKVLYRHSTVHALLCPHVWHMATRSARAQQ